MHRNGDGLLSPDEIKEGMKKQGMNIPGTLEKILKSIDTNGCGDQPNYFGGSTPGLGGSTQ